MEADRRSRPGEVSVDSWYRDGAVRRFLAVRYIPIFAALNFAWEWAHVPLYTIWREADLAYVAFAVAHCTMGDIMIGTSAFLLALILGGERRLSEWNDRRIAVLSVLIGAGYTVFSEWMNVTIVRSWSYAESMPTLQVGTFAIGLTPLAQWLVVPPLTLYLARRSSRR
jgi:hypothetical protein